MARIMRLSDLPPQVRKQVERKMAVENRARTGKVASDGAGRTNGHPGSEVHATEAPVRLRRAPNKTEAEYNRIHLCGRGRYEAVTLRLPGGSRYTPDWMTVDDGRVALHECKGGYRLGSHGRAWTAFREAVAVFTCFAFVWACRKPGGWEIRRFDNA